MAVRIDEWDFAKGQLPIVTEDKPLTLDGNFGELLPLMRAIANGCGKGQMSCLYGASLSVSLKAGGSVQVLNKDLLNILTLPGNMPPCCIRVKSSSEKRDKDHQAYYLTTDELGLQYFELSLANMSVEDGTRILFLGFRDGEAAACQKACDRIKQRLNFVDGLLTQGDLMIPGHNDQWEVYRGKLLLSEIELEHSFDGETPTSFDFNGERAIRDRGYALASAMVEEKVQAQVYAYMDEHEDNEPSKQLLDLWKDEALDLDRSSEW